MSFEECYSLQLELDKRLRPQHIGEKEIAVAIICELGEFLQVATEWRWWGTKIESIIKAREELVDIFHFLLSYLNLKNPDNLTIEHCKICFESYFKTFPSEDFCLIVKRFVGEALHGIEIEECFKWFGKLASLYFTDINNFYNLYMSKNAKNVERFLNGGSKNVETS